MIKIMRAYISLALITVLSVFLLWLPFLFKIDNFWGLNFKGQGLEVIYKNYDGPMYLTVVKSFYNQDLIARHNTTAMVPIYFTAHFPAYPFFVKLFEILIGSLRSMLFTSVLFSVLAVMMFYKFLKEFDLSKNPFFLSILFLFLPARWLIVRGVGSNEPVFVFFLLASLYFFKKTNYLMAGLMGMFVQLTRSPGIILFLGYALYLIWQKKFYRKSLWIFLIPVSLLLLFAFYGMQYNDFFAYFHSGDNIHLEMLPFGVFNSDKPWVGTHWLEDNIFIYLIGAIGVVTLYKKKLYDLFAFCVIYFAATLFVAHRDIIRYSLPIAPFILIAFDEYLNKREFKIAFALILIPIYLFAWNFILHNQAPIADWGPYL